MLKVRIVDKTEVVCKERPTQKNAQLSAKCRYCHNSFVDYEIAVQCFLKEVWSRSESSRESFFDHL